MKIRWFGHSAFEIDADAGTVLLDPWINNLSSSTKPEDIREASVIVVTHDHSDHVGETVPIAKRTGATVCAIPELAAIFRKEGLKVHAPNMGSLTEVQGIKLAFVPAFHTSGTGLPTGAIVKLDEAVIYHMETHQSSQTCLWFETCTNLGSRLCQSEASIPWGPLKPLGRFKL